MKYSCRRAFARRQKGGRFAENYNRSREMFESEVERVEAQPHEAMAEKSISEQRTLFPSLHWFKSMNFARLAGDEVMQMLEGGLSWLERRASKEEGVHEDPRNQGGIGQAWDAEAIVRGGLQVQFRRLKSHLAAVRVECTRRGIIHTA